MKWTGRFSSALARLAEGFLAGLIVLVVANVGYSGAEGRDDRAQLARSAFISPDVLVR